jgi:hypothetical protein
MCDHDLKSGPESILLLQTSKTDNSALDIDAIYNLKLRKLYFT